MQHLIAIDFETSALPEKVGGDLDFSNVHILEIGAVSRSDGKEVTFHAQCRLPAGATATPEALRVNGLDPLQGEEVNGCLHNLRDWLLDSVHECGPAVLVGHNLYGFDLQLLPRYTQGMAIWQSIFAGDRADSSFLCVRDTRLLWSAWCLGLRPRPGETDELFYGRVLGTRCDAPSRLEWLARTFVESTTKQLHGALYDARLTLQVYGALMLRGIVGAVTNGGLL